MPFGNELKDFVSAFSSGVDLFEGVKDRRADRRLKAVQTEAAELELEEYKDPEMRALRRRGTEAEIRSKEAYADYTGVQADWMGNPERQRAEIEGTRAGSALQGAQTRYTGAQAEAQEMENEKVRGIKGAIQETLRRKYGIDAPDAPDASPQSALPTGGQQTSAPQLDQEAVSAILDTSLELGVSPLHLTALMSYETGGLSNPNIQGGKNNQHKGAIQFGPNERATYGYRDGMTLAEQVRGPVKAYLLDRGVRPGHGLAELYSIVNAGSLKNGQPRWNASDGNGDIRSHVARIEQEHLPRAQQLLGYGGEAGSEGSRGSAGQQAIDIMASGTGPSTEPKTGKSAKIARAAAMAYDATRDGLTFAANTMGLTQDTAVPDPNQEAATRDYLTGNNAPDPKLVKSAQDIVLDAMGGKENLSPAAVNLLTLGATYDVYSDIYGPGSEEAKKVAADILMSYRQSFSRWTAVAQAAAEDGNMDGAVEAAVKAYAFVPDGNEVDVNKKGDDFELVVKNIETGETTTKQLVPPNELYAMIMGFGPADFDNAIMAAAGQKAEKANAMSAAAAAALADPSVTPDYSQMTVEEANAVRLNRAGGSSGGGGGGSDFASPTEDDTINLAVRTEIDEYISELSDPEMGSEEGAAAVQRLAPDIRLLANELVRHPEVRAQPAYAVRGVAQLLHASPEEMDPKVLPGGAKATRSEDGKMVTVEFDTMPPLNIPADVFQTIMNQRGALITILKGEAAKQEQRGARDTDTLNRLGAAITAIPQTVGDNMARNLGRQETPILDAIGRGVGAIGRALPTVDPVQRQNEIGGMMRQRDQGLEEMMRRRQRALDIP